MEATNLPIEIHDLTVSYQKRPVLYGIDIEIEEGSLVGIVGPNGAEIHLDQNYNEYDQAKWRLCKDIRQRPKGWLEALGYIPNENL